MDLNMFVPLWVWTSQVIQRLFPQSLDGSGSADVVGTELEEGLGEVLLHGPLVPRRIQKA